MTYNNYLKTWQREKPMFKTLNTLLTSAMILTTTLPLSAQGCCTPEAPCPPPCAPKCGRDCGTNFFDPAVIVGVAAAIAAIVLLTNDPGNGHSH
jgi:hypothetical protein